MKDKLLLPILFVLCLFTVPCKAQSTLEDAFNLLGNLEATIVMHTSKEYSCSACDQWRQLQQKASTQQGWKVVEVADAKPGESVPYFDVWIRGTHERVDSYLDYDILYSLVQKHSPETLVGYTPRTYSPPQPPQSSVTYQDDLTYSYQEPVRQTYNVGMTGLRSYDQNRSMTFADPDGYRSRWTYPGRIDNHLESTHGVSTAGMTKEQMEQLHDSLHEGGGRSTVTFSSNSRVNRRPFSRVLNCPSGACPR